MNRTTKKPTRPGWYWYRPAGDNDEFEMVRVRWCIGHDVRHGEFDRLRVYRVERGDSESAEELTQVHGEWAGPLEVPQ